MTNKTHTTKQLLQLLQNHYIKPNTNYPGGTFLPEVGRNGHDGRRCDAIYIGFTSTSGRILIGHEIKASRADWLNELNNPHKADQWADDCHEWWLVTPPNIVKPGELPAGWGHMIPGTSKTRMKILTKPTRHLNRTPSWDTVRSIIARQDTLHTQTLTKHTKQIREQLEPEYNQRLQHELETHHPKTTQLQKELDTYRQALGGTLDPHHPGHTHFSTTHTIKDLQHAAHIINLHRDLRAATTGLTQPWGPLATLRTKFEELETAIQQALDYANNPDSPNNPNNTPTP